MSEYIFLAFKIAVIAYMYAGVLTEPGHIFSKWKNYWDETLNVKYEDGTYMYRMHWIYDPLVGCALCVSGQMMLWSLVILYFYPDFMLFINICFHIMSAIAIVYLFKNLDKK